MISSSPVRIRMIALAAGVQGFYLGRLNMPERVLFVATAIALIKPGILSDVIGIVVLGGIYLLQRRSLKVKKNKETSGEEI